MKFEPFWAPKALILLNSMLDMEGTCWVNFGFFEES